MRTILLPAILWLVLAAASAQAQARQKLTEQECYQIFPRADACRAAQMPDGKIYWEAWHTGYDDDADELLGYVFLRPMTHEGSEMKLLVGVTTQGTIAKVRIRGTKAIDDEFLAQFEGKSLRSEFQIAKTLEDLLVVPAKIKAQAGKPELSESIVSEIKAISDLALNATGLGMVK
jgi:hypothetical protein